MFQEALSYADQTLEATAAEEHMLIWVDPA